MRIEKNHFPGQAKNEKILVFQKEYPISYISNNFWFILGDIIVAIIVFVILYLSTNIIIATIGLIFILFLGLGILYYLRNNTFLVVTNKRLIKFVKSNIFSEHSKELKIDQINELTFTKVGILPKILNYGNIKIVGKDKENAIWVKGIKYPDEIVQYISRLRDFLIENPEFDPKKLKPFIPRKLRKN